MTKVTMTIGDDRYDDIQGCFLATQTTIVRIAHKM